MKSKNLLLVLAILGIITLILCGCKDQHKPLNNIYYGYYKNDTKYFVILAFNKRYPKKIAVRQNLGAASTNTVLAIQYHEHNFDIHGANGSFKMNISKDSKALTCPTCDGESMPKTYQIGENKGKSFDAHVGDDAIDQIKQLSSKDSGYQIK